MTDNWTNRLSEYIDGDLSAAENEAIEAHVLECADCGETLAQLRAVVFRAGQVIDRPPENDLWLGIAQRIAEPVPAPATAPAAVRERKRFTFSMPQLAAASVVFMMLGSSAMYLVMKQQVTPAPAPAQLAATSPAPGPSGPPAAVTSKEAVTHPVAIKSPAEKNYSAAINELESALHSNTRLDSATVRVLEANLRAIDNAIAEARAALSNDPSNPYLNRYLDETMQRKIQLLRRATGIMRAST